MQSQKRANTSNTEAPCKKSKSTPNLIENHEVKIFSSLQSLQHSCYFPNIIVFQSNGPSQDLQSTVVSAPQIEKEKKRKHAHEPSKATLQPTHVDEDAQASPEQPFKRKTLKKKKPSSENSRVGELTSKVKYNLSLKLYFT